MPLTHDTRPLRVLVLEQDPALRAALARELQATFPAATLFEAASFGAVPGLLGGTVPDAVLAADTAEEPALGTLMTAREVWPGVPVVVLTEPGNEERAAAAIRAGASDFVLTDRLGRLSAVMLSALERRRMREHWEQALVALRESEERYSLAARGANDGLWDWDLRSGRVYYSERWKSMLGHADGEIADSPEEWFSRVMPEDREALETAIREHVEGRLAHLEAEYRMCTAGGDWHWMLARGLAVRDGDGRAYRMAGSQTDVTRQKEVEARLLHDALHDSLTGLSNRTLFMDRLGQALARTRRRADSLLAAFYLDLDQFKVVNDSLGHTIGDSLLMGVAGRIKSCLRPGDTVARIGGDEFAVFVEDVDDVSQALRIAERVHEEFLVPFHPGGNEVFATASVGLVLTGGAYERAEELLRDADIAMYRAKRAGRGRTEIYDGSMHAAATARHRLENDLRRAVERGELRLAFQPIVDLADGRVSSLEALVRWQHPERGLLMPLEFIQVAEEMGAIVPVGEWVLNEACRQLRGWRDAVAEAAGLTISVNLSARQFSQGDVLALTDEALSLSGIPGAALRLELTESVVMEDAEQATRKLHQLRELGVGLDIDDFGTGYSSLSYLRRFPIDALKIDRSFVDGLGQDAEDLAIVRTIVTLAGNLGVDTIAEGIEGTLQLAQLRSLGCPMGQGYHFARPLWPDDVPAVLRAGFASI
ncbi:MAG: EAL domain-containing protein [Vicinamibacteria bacterium]|nr:EAL domain-containing protein [Vicinamibacteria bacterium]